jgi:hypothetical protein
MAEVFWVKDGSPSDTRMSDPHHVPMSRLAEALTPFAKVYHDAPPVFDAARGPAADGAPFTHVVIKVPDEEVNSTFPDEGYYHVRNLAPEECQRLLRIGGAA